MRTRNPSRGRIGNGTLLAGILAALMIFASLNAMSQTVTSLTLVNADTDTDIGPLAGNDVLNLATLPTAALNVRANVGGGVGSVVFGYDGNSGYKTESTAPYAFAGDTNGDYNPWTPALGPHTITATAYSGTGGGGTAGAPVAITFQVVDQAGNSDGVVSGELKQWHRVTIDFPGPATSEGATANPFLDYRLNVNFTHPASGESLTIPGYYAADGDAAETSASGGPVWRVRFAPPRTGTWNYVASFRAGADVAVSLAAGDGSPAAFDGANGSFTVGASDKTGRDFRGKGFLQYVDDHYLRFSGDGERFLKGGADSPENFLGYYEFDNTSDNGGAGNDLPDGLHHYDPHLGDWQAGDPVWQGGKGKRILGALNYLSGKGMNSVYFLTMNVDGDGREVFPWTSYGERNRFDCSKLAQWETVFAHMTRRGLMLHVITQETENDQLLNGGSLGVQRKLYYRELVARFGHHPALVWNLGEENTNTTQQRRDFAEFIRALDAYDHPIVVHTYPGDKNAVYGPLLGYEGLAGPSLQNGGVAETYGTTREWREASAAAGHKWFVCLDEIGPAGAGVVPDASDAAHDGPRQDGLWGNLMAGGAGVEWYFGYQYDHSDLDCEDWRSRDAMWDQTRHALDFFHAHLPFWEMAPQDDLTTSASHRVLAKPGDLYAIYLPDGGTTSLDLQSFGRTYAVSWYDPRSGGELQTGSLATISGSGAQGVGNPPHSPGSDWVVLVRSETLTTVVFGGIAATYQGGRVTVDWQIAGAAELVGVNLRRATGSGGFIRLNAALLTGASSYVDASVAVGATYRYQVEAIDADGVFLSPVATVTIPRARLELAQNFPNPFNPTTRISFNLPQDDEVRLHILDAAGRRVATLLDGHLSAGTHAVMWEGRDAAGGAVPSGVYFYQLQSGTFVRTGRMVLLK